MARTRGFTPAAIRRFGPREVSRIGVAAWAFGRSGVQTLRHTSNGVTRQERGAQELRRAFESLGPTYVKLGQIIASSPLFPDAFSNEFQACLDEVPPVPYEQIREVIADDLGVPPEQLFASFDPKPLASASIAQVHAARLFDGEDVVVKVQRPRIRTRLESDLRVLMRLASVAERTSATIRMANPIAVVEDLAQTLSEELNFVNEARGMERYEANLRRFGRNDDVRVPGVRWPYTSTRVLTMERIRGCKVDDLAEMERRGLDPAEALKASIRAFMEAAFEHGFFHGDMHAGNLMVDHQGKIVLLDFGIVGRFEDGTRVLLREALMPLFISGECEPISRAIFEMSPGSDFANLDEASRDLATLLEPILGQPLDEMLLGDLLVQFIHIGAQHHLRLPRELVLLIKQVLYVERYIKMMAPEWTMFRDPEVFMYLLAPASPDSPGSTTDRNGSTTDRNGRGEDGDGGLRLLVGSGGV